MTTNEKILANVTELLREGTPPADIRINDGCDIWGESGASTVALMDELIEEWEAEGQDCSDLPSLLTLEEWAESRGLPVPVA